MRTLLTALAVVVALYVSAVPARQPECQLAFIKYRDTPVCLDRGFEYQSTPKSSWIGGAWYDRKNQYMVINLKGTLYHYCRMPPEIWAAFKVADSYGRFYEGNIKGRFDCRLGGVPAYD